MSNTQLGTPPGVPASCPVVVVAFSPAVSAECLDWFQQRVEAPRERNGGELLVERVAGNGDQEQLAVPGEGGSVLFLVRCSTERLLAAAEMMEMKRLDHKNGIMMDFTIKSINDFVKPGDDVDELLSNAEKQRIILHELESIRATSRDAHIPGHGNLTLYPGKPIIHKLKNNGLVTHLFPLHDRARLKRLGEDWYKHFLHKQPIGEIRSYFGEHIAMYFAFLGSYAVALIPPALLGIFYYITSWDQQLHLGNNYTAFSVFNVVWVTLFLEVWKRNCAELAYIWGTLGYGSGGAYEQPRPAFKGTMAVSEITGKEEPHYPTYKRQLKKYCVSLPIVLLSLCVATGVMLGYVECEYRAAQYHKSSGEGSMTSLLLFVPSIVYTVCILAMNAVYRVAMDKLTTWENHRVQSAHDNSLITKLVVFEFVNCFGSLFYVAFYEQDMEKLRRHLAALLITTQLIDQLVETLMPYVKSKWRRWQVKSKRAAAAAGTKGTKGTGADGTSLTSEGLDTHAQARVEMSLDVYPGTFFDYLELFLQFGYVFLFSSVFPLAALWAFLNNLMEIRSDAFKLCRALQRSQATPSANIGVWQIVFEIMGVIAVITNCSLIALSPSVRSQITNLIGPSSTEVHVLLVFVFAEHILIAAKCVLAFVIPDVPEWVRKAVCKTDYLSKQAFKQQKRLSVKQEMMAMRAKVQ